RAHRPASPVRLLPRARRVRPAAGRRGGGAPLAVLAHAVRDRLRGGDRDALPRPRRARRDHRAHGAGGSRCAPQPPPAAQAARAHGLRGAACDPRATARGGPAPLRPRPAASDRRRRARAGRDRGAPAVRHARRTRIVGIRCVYTDLDGTLLGRGASLFRTAEGEFTLLAARALEACHRAGAEVVIKSGRRRAQVMEDARLLGQSSYIFEVGAAMVIDGETTFLTGDFQPRDGESVHEQIAATGAPDLLVSRYE